MSLRISNQAIASNVSNSASFNSSVLWSDSILRASFQIVVSSGSCGGTFKIQGSNDLAQGLPANQFLPTNWINIGSTSIITCSTSAIGSSSVFLIPYTELVYEYVRIAFVDLSGGSANGVVTIRAKTAGL